MIKNSQAGSVILTGRQTEKNDDCACPDRAFILTFDFADGQENDCACPDTLVATTSSTGANARFHQVRELYREQIWDGFWLVLSPYAPHGPCVLSEEAWKRLQDFALPGPLSQPVDHILVEQNLLVPFNARSQVRLGKPETLTAWLHVTNACNLDCPYCYVRKSSASMSLETGLRAVENLFVQAQENGFSTVKLKYAGGESTLQFRLIRSIHARARQLAQATGLQLQGVVLSNGTTLRPADADWLLENNVRLMVSLDGVGRQHDLMRPTKDGGSSFAALSQAVDKLLLPRGIHPFASITISRWNVDGVAEAVRWALERELPVSLNFYRQTQSAPGDLALEETAIINGMLAAYAVFEEVLPTRPFLNGLLDRVQMDAHLQTCGVGMNYLVITHEGKLAQCQMHQEQSTASIADKDWLPVLNHGWIHNLPVDDKDECQVCLYRYRCSGGCPLETYRASGRWNAKNPNCQIYKALLPAALRLEGLRLLKANGYLH
jgi:uncharacterized protein